MTFSTQEKARQRCNWLPELAIYPGPRYRALADAITDAVRNGTLPAGTRLPPQRLLADALSVTTGTITRAYAEAERRGILTAQVGSGTYVRDHNTNKTPIFNHPVPLELGEIDLSMSLTIPDPTRIERFGRALQQVSCDPSALTAALSYQPEQGMHERRQTLAQWLSRYGVTATADDLLLTQGGQHGIFTTLQSLLRPGELVISDNLTYPGLIAACKQLGLRHQGVAMDAEGMDVAALERVCQQQHPRLVYLMPDLNNPTSIRMSLERRHQMAELAERYDFLILEDATQALPASERLTPLCEIVPERACHLFSFSKLLAGGICVGVIKAPEHLMRLMKNALRAQCWMCPPLPATVLCQWIENGEADEQAKWQWQEVNERQRLVTRYLEGYDYQHNPYGFMVWLNMPEPWRASDFVQAAMREGVRILSAEPFCAGNHPAPQAVRFCVSPPGDRQQLDTALQRIQRLLQTPPQCMNMLV
ncbi:PLP-dependent aminotransferase family protein [Nitrincola alkalilacustris]|uniref:aminotransferase-like domain-containing protein n=1 Tax=Nitrincola alkalilacustris TaxID=1571224 RepID=UPI00124D26A0|nr:PLP-dependent aminotransferase family protein [Nitrincola alkalilacustris]